MAKKTLADVTVKKPETFSVEKLKSLQEARVAGFLRSPVSKKQIIAFTFVEFCKEFEQLIQGGYTCNRELPSLTSPFIVYMNVPAHLLEQEIERVKEEVEAEYRADLSRQVEEARQALVQQRLAFFEEKERKAEEEKKAKLLAELEQEAADLFKHST
jgi:hypothetical protein